MRKVILKSKSNGRLLRGRRMFSPPKWIALDLSVTRRRSFIVVYSRPRRAARVNRFMRMQKCTNIFSHLCSFTGDCMRRVLRRMPCVERRFPFATRSWWLFRVFEAFRAGSVDMDCATACDYIRTGAGEDIYCPRSVIRNFHSMGVGLWRAMAHGGTGLPCSRRAQLLNHFPNLYEWRNGRGEEKRGEISSPGLHY